MTAQDAQDKTDAQRERRTVSAYSWSVGVICASVPAIGYLLVEHLLPNAEEDTFNASAASVSFVMGAVEIMNFKNLREFAQNFGQGMYRRFHAPKNTTSAPEPE